MKLTDEQRTLIINTLVGVDQGHPRHCHNLLDHTKEVVAHCASNAPELQDIAWVHDVGKPAVKAWNEEKGHDTFYKHAAQSVMFCEEHGIELSDDEKALIKHHDLAFVNKKSLAKFARKYGPEWVQNQLHLRLADLEGQDTSRQDVQDDMSHVSTCESWLGELASVAS